MARSPSVSDGAAISAAMIRNAPPIPDATTARMIVRGVVARGLCVSSDSSPALSKPTSTYAAINAEMSSGTTYPVRAVEVRRVQYDGRTALGAALSTR